MSVRVNPDLFCDSCGEWVSGYPDFKAADIRRRWAKRGWKRRRVDGRLIDLCPICATSDLKPPARKEGDE